MILILGSNSFIGNYIKEYFIDNKIIFCELNNYDNLQNDIIHFNPDYIICAIEKSYDKNIYSTNYIENKLSINLKYNIELPLCVNDICNKLKIHCTQICNGCLYTTNNSNENTLPDLHVSEHSTVSGFKNKLLNNCLQLRFRYPISGDFNPMCYLSKLISYNKLLNCDNSVSVLPSLIPVMLKLIYTKEIGVYNFVNNGNINSINTLIDYKYNIDSHCVIEEMSKKEHDNIIGIRSNVIVNNNKLNNLCNSLYKKNNIESLLKYDGPINRLNIEEANNSIKELLNNYKKYCKELKVCLCCKMDTLKTVINLGYQPLANDFHQKEIICKNYPLHLMYCKNCYHNQLSHSINPDILFKNYKYVSGTSNTGLKFFKDNAKMITDLFPNKGKILDIACNDGSQLNYFLELGWETWGIDPAENICPIADKAGHEVVCDYFNEESSKKHYNGFKFDVITAQNVFAHTEYIDSFLQGCKDIMHLGSSLFIQTSQRDMIQNGEFDTIYHEHISFYSTKSMRTLVERNGLILYKVREHLIHGRSYIFEIKLNENNKELLESEIIEEQLGLYSPIIYEKFNLITKTSIINIKNIINKYPTYKLIGCGAAAKGQTLICYGNIELDYIIDENPLKIGLFSPKLDIPIVSMEHFENDTSNKNFLIIILAWNFAKEIIEKINLIKNNKNIIFIEKYFNGIILS